MLNSRGQSPRQLPVQRHRFLLPASAVLLPVPVHSFERPGLCGMRCAAQDATIHQPRSCLFRQVVPICCSAAGRVLSPVHPSAGCPAWTRRACRQVAGGPDNWDTSKQNSQAGSYNTVGPTGDPEAHQYAERDIERARQVWDGQTERGMLLKETSLHKNTVGGAWHWSDAVLLELGHAAEVAHRTVHTGSWLVLELWGGVPVPDEPAEGC